jgi:predicted  nucleic acid-binding Zn-ribbon protein
LREESTRIKEVGTIQTTELEEIVSKETELVESLEKTISTSKETLTSLRSKEKEINTKISITSEQTEVESLRRELVSVTS